MKNIEVEIRGGLNKESYTIFLNFLKEKGEYIESQNRQMILLYDYPGFDINPLARNVDIRLRETNGFCELMIKNKITENNEARNEISINLSQNTWEENIFFLKSLGIKRGLWMKRKKEVYMLSLIHI